MVPHSPLRLSRHPRRPDADDIRDEKSVSCSLLAAEHGDTIVSSPSSHSARFSIRVPRER